MKVSVNAIRYLNQHYASAGEPAPQGVPDLLRVIGAQLAAVDETIDFGQRFNGVIIARVVTCMPHSDSDHLHVCMIDDGGAVKHVERNDSGLVQVVCGAPNVREGLTVAWLPPGTTVPESFEKEPMVLDARTIRGQKSNGMLASSRELALGDNHDGILEIDGDIAPGTPFAEAFHLTDDVIIDMENKMFTHRPDCFGWLGIARELEGIQHRPYKSPDWYIANPTFPDIETDELKLEVHNELPELVPRFTAITMRGVKVGPSPVWLQADLARAGMKSVNNIVDYTNWYMILTGQPLHAFDYDKVAARSKAGHAALTVRYPKKDEKIALLNGKEIQPRDHAIMIATDDQLIGVAGIMGGRDTEVDEHTTNIIIECATFDMYSVRRTSMAHGLFTDAVTRFTKGQSPLQNLAVLAKIVDQIRSNAGGKVASKVVDINHVHAATQRGSVHPSVTVAREFINARLGWDLTTAEMATLLENVEFGVAHTPDELTVTAPFWRTDIEIPEDVVEEIGRLRGYDLLPLELPKRTITPAVVEPIIALKNTVRHTLAKAGANEVLGYSFVPGDLLTKTGQDKKHAFQISNALSPDLQYYRLSLTPSLLANVHPNIKAGYKQFGLFEINKVHIKGDIDCDGLPREYQAMGFVYASDNQQVGASYYQAATYLDYFLGGLNIPYKIVPATKHLEWEIARQIFAPFEPKRSAFVLVGANDEFAGFVGEYKTSVRKNLKLPNVCAGFELDLERLLTHQNPTRYRTLSKFPASDQDMCFKVKDDLTYAEVVAHVQASLAKNDQLTATVTPLDIYKRKDDTTHKQITVSIRLQHSERTLTTPEVNSILDTVVQQVSAATGAVRI